MYFRYLFTYTVTISLSLSVFAQPETSVSQFWHTQLHTNSGIAGIHNRHEANAHYLNQWDKVNGAPNALFVNYAARIPKIHGAAGIDYMYQTIGLWHNHTIRGVYAFHAKLGKYVLSPGIGAGLHRTNVSPTWHPPSTINDPSLPAGKNVSFLSLNFGAVFHAPQWNAGISVSTQTGSGGQQFGPASRYWFFADYTWNATAHFGVRPQLQLITNGIKYGNHVSVIALLYHFWGGITYGHNNYVGVTAGYDFFGKYRISYGYDYTTNKLSSVSKGTHQANLSWRLR